MSGDVIGLIRARWLRGGSGSVDLLELRQTSLELVLWATAGLAGLVVLAPDPLLARSLAPTGYVSAGLLASAGAGLALRRWSPTFASAALVIGLGASLAVAADAFSADTTLPWLALLVLVSTALLGRRGGLAVGFTASFGLAVILPRLPVAASPAMIAGAQAMIWASMALSWLVTRPLYVALDWSWRGYEQAAERTREAERHRGELAGALKALDEACHRLEQANHELSRARQAAEDARQLKVRLAAFVSHEIRLPLNIITGFSEMMVMSPISYDGQVLPDAYRADVEAIYRAAFHLSSLVDDVLDLSEIDAHHLGLQKEWISLGDVVEQACAAARGLFQSKGLWLAADLSPDLPLVLADRGRIRQIVMNLLKNAVRFTDVGGARVDVAAHEGEVVVSVSDTGIGIAPNDLDHVFDEFHQLDAAGGRRAGGSGLGLAICKRFVEMHGGNVWVESRPGRGSSFSFSIPRRANVVASPLREPWESWTRSPPLADQPTVAVVGSDPRSVNVLQRHLDGYRVLGIPGVQELEQVVANESIRAVIVVGVDDPEARTLACRVRADLSTLPVVACALRATRADAARALGIADFLIKPVDRGAVVHALGAVGTVGDVVVVDDDPDMARLLASMVRLAFPRAQIWIGGGGEEALALIETHHPGAVLLDLVMPGVDGYEVIRRMGTAGQLRDTAVIAVTAGTGGVEGVAAEIGQITRAGGLTAGELIRCLRGTLDALLGSPAPS